MHKFPKISRPNSRRDEDAWISQIPREGADTVFPNEFEGRSKRFENRQKDLEDQLLPMLHSRDEEPALAGLMADAEEFTSAYILPRDDGERLYLESFAKGEYRPELIFGECDIARAAAASPEAQWKLANLKKMSDSGMHGWPPNHPVSSHLLRTLTETRE